MYQWDSCLGCSCTQVETLTALMTTEGKEPLNARQRRTLRR